MSVLNHAKRLFVHAVLAGIALLAATSSLAAGDWPQWRFDANRSGATDEAGPSDPALRWQLALDYPEPAFDHQYRMCADVTYASVAAEGLLFVPSNVTDQVMACDLETGSVRWRFTAEGPVRFAPVYREGRLYFGADDGYLYCVSAQEGKLLWRVRGVPEALCDSRMLVNGRMCSRWPARGAPLESQGVIYFGAGIWPEEGVYVSAVNGETGEVLWRSDRMSYIKDGMSDHGRPHDLSLPPQGYLAMIDGKLAVPSGRSLAAWFDPATGTMEPYTCFYVKDNPPRGTWYLAGINRFCVQGGNWFGTRPDAAPAMPAGLGAARSALNWSKQTPENEQYVIEHRPFLRADTYRVHDENLYTEPVLTATTAYASEYTDETKYLIPRGHTRVAFPEFDRIVARDLTRPQWTVTPGRRPADGQILKLHRLEFPIVWQLASPLRVLIKAGDRLYAGGKDTVAAVEVPAKGAEPRIAWQMPVDGTPVNALVAAGKLVVVTDNGNVFCFGSGPGTPPAGGIVARSTKDRFTSPRLGYACLLGWGNGVEAQRLAAENQYRVIAFELDPAKAREARERLTEAGAAARQVQVLAGSPDRMAIAPYWANLVVAESLEDFVAPEALLSSALDLLRPETGKLRLPHGRPYVELLRRLLAERTGYEMRLDRAAVTIERKSPPHGADAWSHESGGPANCFANSEQLVKWPLGVLWYSGDIDRYFTPASHFQHERQPYPLVVGGRMFLITGQDLHAVDIYTGSYLWHAEMPLTPWVQTRFFDSRIYGRPTERNLVAASDWVYVVIGDRILAYDAATGRQVKAFEVPSRLADEARKAAGKPQEAVYMGFRAAIQAAPLWTEVRLWNDSLLAVLGHTLVAVDRHTGEVRWMRPSTRQTTTYAVGNNMLFGLDCDVPRMGGDGSREDRSGLLFALSPETGAVAWQHEPRYAAVPKHEVDHPRLWLLPILPELSYNAKHRLVVMTVNRGSVCVFHASDGSPAWSKPNPIRGNLEQVYPPVVTDDYLVLSNYLGYYGYLLDISTGQEVGANTAIPRPRSCGRIIGNNNLLVYRDAATEFYDTAAHRMIEFNSVRSGCTTSFVPAGGMVTAPMLAHGCVCNYPMFASLGLYHWPQIDQFRPAAVTKAWVNQAGDLPAGAAAAGTGATMADPFASATGEKIDVQKFRPVNATIAAAGAGLLLSTKDENAGYAIRQTGKPLDTAVFTFRVMRAPGKNRHGNAFFVCGSSDKPEDWIECRLYYGGRRSMAISGSRVKPAEKKVTLPRTSVFTVTVSVDCRSGTVAFEADGGKLTSTILRPMGAITHYGCGGANADNVFSEIRVQ